MAEVLVEYSDVVISAGDEPYMARACGRPVASGHWQGWLEFIDVDTGDAVRSPRETTQPNRTDTVYWATGLTPIYLEGALQRALHPMVRAAPRSQATPVFDEPAPDLAPEPPVPDSILNPFSVYRKGEALLAPSARRLLGVAPGQHRSRLSAERSVRGDVERDARPTDLIDLIVGREAVVRVCHGNLRKWNPAR